MNLYEIDTELMITGNIYCGKYGWYIEFYREDDDYISYWYGDQKECLKILNEGNLPNDIEWIPAQLTYNGSPPYDAATATGMYD